MQKKDETNQSLVEFFKKIFQDSLRLFPAKKTPGQIPILCHTSLSSFGRIENGPVILLDSLLRACKNYDLTLVMPSHSDSEITDGYSIPEICVYDKSTTTCTAMGITAETFRRMKGVRRSDHPLLSFCAKGSLTRQITTSHRCEFGLGEKSPLGKLYNLDALVLMLGTSYESCTAIHLAEYMNAEKCKAAGKTVDRVTCRAGVNTWKGPVLKTWEDLLYKSESFPDIGAAFERECPDKFLNGPLWRREDSRYRIMRFRDIVDFSIDRCRVLE